MQNNDNMVWKPNVTVAAVIERDGKFLLIEEESERGLVYNQPAGHLEHGESLINAVVRETLEESAYHFEPRTLIGIYQIRSVSNLHLTYLRFTFAGDITGHEPDRPLDTGIVGTSWLTADEIRASGSRHRTPLVMRCVDDYLSGARYPLSIITQYD